MLCQEETAQDQPEEARGQEGASDEAVAVAGWVAAHSGQGENASAQSVATGLPIKEVPPALK